MGSDPSLEADSDTTLTPRQRYEKETRPKRLAARRLAGICRRCKNPAAPGRASCEAHLAQDRASQALKAQRRRSNRESRPINLRPLNARKRGRTPNLGIVGAFPAGFNGDHLVALKKLVASRGYDISSGPYAPTPADVALVMQTKTKDEAKPKRWGNTYLTSS